MIIGNVSRVPLPAWKNAHAKFRVSRLQCKALGKESTRERRGARSPSGVMQELAPKAAVQLLALPLTPVQEAQRARGLALLEGVLRASSPNWRAALTAARPHLTALEQVQRSTSP